MTSVAHENAQLVSLLEQIEKAGIERHSLEVPLAALLDRGDTSPLLAWAHQQGEHHARLRHAVSVVIEELMLLGSALINLCPDTDEKLPSALVSAGVEGYQACGIAAPIAEHNDNLRQRVAELTALHRINSAANSSLNLNDMLNETAQAVVAVTGADMCSIFLYEPQWNQLVLAATSGLNQSAVGKVRLQLGEGITGWAAFVGKPTAVRDAWSDPRFKYVPALEEERAVSILAVPVVLFTKEKLLGVITVHTFEEHDFTAIGVQFLETVAGEIAIAIENARLYEQTDARLQQKVEELSTLQGVSAHIAATLNLPEVLTLIAYQAAHLVHADAAAMYEMHPDAGVLELVAQYDLQDPNHSIHQGNGTPRLTLNVEESSIAQALLRGIPTPLPPHTDDGLGLPFAADSYRSMFCVPLVAPRNIMGGICLYNREERQFSDEQAQLLDAFAHEAAIALENSRLYDAAIRGLQTKSAMLQEMNHRVRNNLQTVAGLLSMQLRRIPADSDGAIAVRESVARVQSIAAVHDLMMSGDVESISLYELARKVAEAAISTLSKPDFELALVIEPDGAEDIRVNSHEATLLTLLLNELISNAILHGFAGKESGEIRIEVERSAEWGVRSGEYGMRNCLNIAVMDDGSGLLESFDPKKDAHLGLSIVQTLVVSDLRGTFSIAPREDSSGTVASLSFMPSQPARSNSIEQSQLRLNF